MRIIFLGTPDFAVPALTEIAQKYDVVGVVTQTDKPTGRSGKIMFSAVKQQALKLGLNVLQFASIKKEGVQALKQLKPDIMITCAYGQILNKDILDIAPIYNIHASLLPKYRGASPIQSAILCGEKQTGITILQTTLGLDEGPILYQQKLDIYEDETAGQLFDRLSKLGAECILKVLQDIQNGHLSYIEQEESKATFTKIIKKEDGKINFASTTKDIINKVRAFNPWPLAFTKINDTFIKVYKAVAVDINTENKYTPGDVVFASGKAGLVVKTADGFVRLLDIKPDNAKLMHDKDYLNGKKIKLPLRLGDF